MKNKLLVMFVGIIFILGGCQSTQKKAVDKAGTEVKADKLASDVKSKYDERVTYAEENLMIERDESITVELAFDVEKLGYKNATEIVEIYQNTDLTQKVLTQYEISEKLDEIVLNPPQSAVGALSAYSTEINNRSYGYKKDDAWLFKKEKDWGNLQNLYKVVYVDLETGEKLKKPEVTVISIIHELDQKIQLKMKLNEQGVPEYSWNKVPGAEYYHLLQMDYSKERGYSSAFVVGTSEETTFVQDSVTRLQTFSVSEAGRLSAASIEEYGEGDEPIPKETFTDQRFMVIAVSKEGTSAVSNGLNLKDMAARIPAIHEMTLSDDREGKRNAETIDELPSYQWITMCDGYLVRRLVTYDVEKTEIFKEHILSYEKPDMSDAVATGTIERLSIPYTIDGTGYTGFARVTNFDKENFKKDLSKLEEKQSLLQKKAGAKEADVVGEQEAEKSEKKQKASSSVSKTEDKITANSALSEYLAINMLSGNRVIDLEKFPEAAVQSLLSDAWMEAIYQNPLILGADSAAVSKDGKSLFVEYNMDIAQMKKQQKTLRSEVKKVIAEIITEDMSDLQKEYAINQYLCDIAEYDNAALDNAAENEFLTVDEAFNDSFTPYGVLINKVGVCASYAGAFKLLADAADLEAIVVTGYLNGDLPHAWNKVKVNGEWNVLDATNNDDELLANPLLNISGKAARKVLVEDDRYVLDNFLTNYVTTEDVSDKEFYRVENRFYEEEKIAEELALALQKDSRTALRTVYDLDDKGFSSITNKVIEKTQNEEIQGFYWMGVIYMEDGSKSDK
ncbi:transglutaminase domain-containing protein [Enterococcus sp. LJL51]|uniref:transglutaminase domain-containing protein n=1 Tax=Enterococcus sp. LJL51 TaxID=3416656 RepID=UPI003CF3315E